MNSRRAFRGLSWLDHGPPVHTAIQNVWNAPGPLFSKAAWAFWNPDFVACAGVEGAAAGGTWDSEPQDHSALPFMKGPWCSVKPICPVHSAPEPVSGVADLLLVPGEAPLFPIFTSFAHSPFKYPRVPAFHLRRCIYSSIEGERYHFLPRLVHKKRSLVFLPDTLKPQLPNLTERSASLSGPHPIFSGNRARN